MSNCDLSRHSVHWDSAAHASSGLETLDFPPRKKTWPPDGSRLDIDEDEVADDDEVDVDGEEEGEEGEQSSNDEGNSDTDGEEEDEQGEEGKEGEQSENDDEEGEEYITEND